MEIEKAPADTSCPPCGTAHDLESGTSLNESSGWAPSRSPSRTHQSLSVRRDGVELSRALPVDIREIGFAGRGGQRVIAPGAGQVDLISVLIGARRQVVGEQKCGRLELA